MKTPLLILLLITSMGLARPPSAAAIKRTEALIAETIPHLDLKDATPEQALDAVRAAWKERHPDVPFPVGVANIGLPDTWKKDKPVHITLELKDVPFYEALTYLADFSGWSFSLCNGLVQIENRSFNGFVEDWYTTTHDIPPKALASLKLHRGSTSEEVRSALAAYGVELEDWEKPFLAKDGKSVALTCLPAKHQEIAGIIALLGKGFKISK